MMNNAILMMVDKERVGDEGYEMIQMMNEDLRGDLPLAGQPAEMGQEPLEQAARI